VAQLERTYLTPPRLHRFPRPDDPLEYSSRSTLLVGDGRRLLRAWGTPERPWVLAIEPLGARWRVEGIGVEPLKLRAAARAFLSLDHPLEEFYRHLRREPVLAGSERRFRGLRLPRDPHLFESIVHAIIGQQISVAAALLLLALPRAKIGSAASAIPVEHNFRAELEEGFAFIRRNRFMVEIIGIGMIVNFFGNGIAALFAPYAAFVLHGGAADYGFLGAFVAVGSLVGAGAMGRVDTHRSAGRYLFGGGRSALPGSTTRVISAYRGVKRPPPMPFQVARVWPSLSRGGGLAVLASGPVLVWVL